MTQAHLEPGWDGLVTAALLGTTRRPVTRDALAAQAGPALGPTVAALPDEVDADPARALLDAAALTGTQRRAGRRPASAEHLPAVEPVPADPLVEAGAVASLRLDDLLRRADSDLLAEWLRAAAALGRRVPTARLVALLTAVSTVPELRRPAVVAGGERARWLIRQWHEAGHPLGAAYAGAVEQVGTPSRPAEAEVEGPHGDGDEAWRTGSRAQRVAWLAALRRRDPDAARQVLLDAWAAEPPADRSTFLEVLAENLTLADDAFLETCLDERRAETRAVAVRLLTRLPGSGLSRRMAARATGAVRRERRLVGSRFVVDQLPMRDAAAARDGVPPYRGQGGEGRWVLLHVLAATPLGAWSDDAVATPAQVVGLPVVGDWGPVLHEGWARAAVAQRSEPWADALLAHEQGALPHDGVVALADVLSPGLRARRAAALLRSGVSARQGERWLLLDVLLHRCPAPWPDELADAVVAWLGRVRPDEVVHISRALVRLAGRRLPPDRAPQLLALTGRRGPDLLTPMLTEAADLLAYRHDLVEELRR